MARQLRDPDLVSLSGVSYFLLPVVRVARNIISSLLHPRALTHSL
jgi:hypothetical protein